MKLPINAKLPKTIMTIPFPSILTGIKDIADNFDAFMLDLFGLLHNGRAPYPHTVETLQALKDAGKKVCLLSNTPRTGKNSMEDLAAMGIARSLYTDIVTAGDSARIELQEQHQGKKIWFIGKEGFRGLIEGLDLREVAPEDCELIVNAVPSTPEEQQDIVQYLPLLAPQGIKMICANPDLVVMIDGERRFCSGTYALHYEQHGGVVHYHGKPYNSVYDMAWEKLNRPDRSRVCVMGDAIHTDVQGGHRNGFYAVLALTGIHREDIFHADYLGALDVSTTYDPARLETLIKTAEWAPNAIIPSFRWSS